MYRYLNGTIKLQLSDHYSNGQLIENLDTQYRRNHRTALTRSQVLALIAFAFLLITNLAVQWSKQLRRCDN